MDKEIHLIDTWEFVKKQKLKGERVAWLLLGLDEDDFESRYHQQPQLLSNENSIFGVLVNEILIVYGDQFQVGKHGYSLRNSGFRFDINTGSDHEHPWSDDPMLIEDPLNYMNNVGRNCYKAQQFQRVIADAHETLKNITVRHNEMKKIDMILSEIFGI